MIKKNNIKKGNLVRDRILKNIAIIIYWCYENKKCTVALTMLGFLGVAGLLNIVFKIKMSSLLGLMILKLIVKLMVLKILLPVVLKHSRWSKVKFSIIKVGLNRVKKVLRGNAVGAVKIIRCKYLLKKALNRLYNR